jgi:rifampicin phosphotransferase
VNENGQRVVSGGLALILTGTEIAREWANGRLVIDPFTPEHVNPNSFNFRLGPRLYIYQPGVLDPRRENPFDEVTIPEEGYVLQPGRLYLGHTIEILGSDHYAPTFSARSSVARLGLFINLSASLGDIGFKGQWTLQLYAISPIRIYAGMIIGQMMWWKPQGEIQLYEGKYQGSTGPRVSDSHKDFERQMARQRFPSLGASVESATVGSKFAQLSSLSSSFNVPAAFAIPAVEFEAALTERQKTQLAAEFSDARATVGAFLADAAPRLAEIVAEIRVPPDVHRLLSLRMAETFGKDRRCQLAVRSSGLDEDGAAQSLAGVHRSVLGVEGIDGVVSAIEQCWRAYYELPGVAARIRLGNHDWRPRIALFVQEMVQPELAGVAFSGLAGDPDHVRIEYVEGLADRLVAGEQIANSADSSSTEMSAFPTLRSVVSMVRELRHRLGHDVDVEWASDGDGVKLLQCRPVTARMSGEDRSDLPSLEAYRLYREDPPASFGLGEVAGVYGGYVAKRGPAHRLARELGIAIGSGWVIRFNRRGLRDPATRARLAQLLDQGSAPQCVLDLSETLRQVILSKTEVADWLSEAACSEGGGAGLATVIVRDFIRGNAGVISKRIGDGLLVEITADGLLALNRGTASAQRLTVLDLREPNVMVTDPGTSVLVSHLPSIIKMTQRMEQRYGSVALEWVLADDGLYFTDYSVLSDGDLSFSSSAAVVLAPGSIQGPVLELTEDALLERLSIGPAVSIDRSLDVSQHEGLARIIELVRSQPERPIVKARRPYAVLSVLIGDVAGFVFEGGSILCHLAILLREAGVPAVVSTTLSGDYAVISDGVLTMTRREAVR